MGKRRRRRSRHRPSTWTIVGLSGVAVLAVAVTGFALLSQPEPPARSTGSFEASTPPPVTRERVSAYFIGDSLAAGTGAKPGQSFPNVTGRVMNWAVTTDAIGGSGYTGVGLQPDDATEELDRSFPTRLDDVIEAEPDVVIVAGGRNDRYTALEDVGPVAREYLEDMRAGLPDAEIVVLSPFLWHTSSELMWVENTQILTDELEEIAADVDAVFIDTHAEFRVVDDSTRDTLYADDGGHLTTEGYKILAHQLARSLVEHGLERGPERWQQTGFQTGKWVDPSDHVFED